MTIWIMEIDVLVTLRIGNMMESKWTTFVKELSRLITDGKVPISKQEFFFWGANNYRHKSEFEGSK